MAGIPRYIYSTLSTALFGSSRDELEIDYASERYSSDRYRPSVSDVLSVKAALHKKSTLPYELVDAIVDTAEYWPHTSTILQKSSTVRGGKDDRENRFILRSFPLGYLPQIPLPVQDEYQIGHQYDLTYKILEPRPWPESRHVPDEATNEVISNWTSKSLPKGEHPCRKIVFTIKSHDQGWGGNINHRGTYEGSYTWFDVGLERMSSTREAIILDKPELAPSPQFELNSNGLGRNGLPSTATSLEPLICNLRTILPVTPQKPCEKIHDSFHHDLLPSAMALQKNVTATRGTKEHKITWSFDDNVVTDSLDAAALEKEGRGRETGNGEFVRNLKIGDVITVWAKARFAQWLNVVEEVKMDVYWAI